MLKATFKSAPLILLVLTALLSGCADPEAQKAKKLTQAEAHIASADYDAAQILLNELAESDPGNLDVLRSRIALYQAQGDAAAVAFLMQEAQRLAPNDIEILYKTYLAQEAAGQPSAEYLEEFARVAPDAMTPELWEKLGSDRAADGQSQAALNAYLKAAAYDGHTPASESAVAIGQLFLQVDNTAQAERWFKLAAESDDPNALAALFGLLEINLRNKNWPEAEIIVQQLEAQFPGAIGASQWAEVPDELAKWRKAQDEMRAKLEKEKADAAAKAKAEAEAKAKEAAEKEAALAAQSEEVTEIADAWSEDQPTPSDKSEVVAELEAAEAMADQPAIETEPTVEFNPDISIEPADPDLTVGVSFDQQANGATVEYNVSSSETVANADTPADSTIEAEAYEVAPPMTVEELLTEAETAEQQRDYDAAIQYYWQALGQANDRADIWNRLSRAYVIDGQPKNAETAALESLRLDPSNVNTMLDYLRIAQRTKAPRDFLAELETAADRFPQSPEIALSLGRGYERIAKNNPAALRAYSRFIELAPSHPLRPEAESAIARLR
ncbi:MAG: tetratricopeptide repeat protein [Coraliomargarita sp.]